MWSGTKKNRKPGNRLQCLFFLAWISFTTLSAIWRHLPGGELGHFCFCSLPSIGLIFRGGAASVRSAGPLMDTPSWVATIQPLIWDAATCTVGLCLAVGSWKTINSQRCSDDSEFPLCIIFMPCCSYSYTDLILHFGRAFTVHVSRVGTVEGFRIGGNAHRQTRDYIICKPFGAVWFNCLLIYIYVEYIPCSQPVLPS